MVGRAVLAFGQATLPSPHLLSRQHVCHGSSVWPCGLTQLKQSRCSAYLWLAAPLLLSDYFAISTLAVSAAGVPWFFSLALRPCSAIGQSRCSAFYGWPHRCCFRITLPSPHLLPRQQVCHGSSVWPCGLTQLEQSRCSAYLWLAAPLLLPDELLCHLHTCCLGSRCAIVL